MSAALNVLFVVIDQLRADVLCGALAPYVPTPNLDRLGSESLVFANHTTVTAPCGPSRASLLTGLRPERHGSLRNGTPMRAGLTNLALEVRKLGREPLLFGYTDTTPDPATVHPNDPDRGSYETVLSGFREITEMRLESGYEWPGYLLAKGYDVPLPLHADPMALHRPQGGALGGPALYAAEDSDTAYLTDEVIKALAVRPNPWFAHVSYIRPHPPLVAPAPYHVLVDPQHLPPPRPRTDAPAHPFLNAWFAEPSKSGLFHGFDGDVVGMTEETTALLRATYLGLVAEVDHHIGRLLRWLDASGQRDRTLVVVTADHAEMLGDYGQWGKDTVFPQAFHIPLLIRLPGAGAGRVDAATESVDIMPTILDALGADHALDLDGRSLLGAPERGSSLRRMDIAFGDEGERSRFDRAFDLPTNGLSAVMVDDGVHRLVRFQGAPLPDLLLDSQGEPLAPSLALSAVSAQLHAVLTGQNQ